MSRIGRWLTSSFSREAPVFDEAWRPTLEQGFEHWRMLTPDELTGWRSSSPGCSTDTRWEPANGFELTDDIKVMISAQASMLLLGLELDDYPQLTSIIVYPSTVRLSGEHGVTGRVRSSETQTLAGQAHYQGPVVLSWSAAKRGARFPAGGQNVVYHEFAHQLDMLDGITDGTPPLGDEDARLRWVEVCTTAYDTRPRRRIARAARLRRYQSRRVLRGRHRGLLQPPCRTEGTRAGALHRARGVLQAGPRSARIPADDTP